MKYAVGLVVIAGATALALASPNDEYRTSKPAQGTLTRPGTEAFTDAKLKQLKVPANFTVSVFAKDVKGARWMAQAPAGGPVYVSQPSAGSISILTDSDKDGDSDSTTTLVSGYKKPHGLALGRDGNLYFVAMKEVYKVDPKSKKATTVITGLPDVGQHENRVLALSDDNKLYVSIASNCNACVDPNPELATMLVFNADGSGKKIYAKGLRDTLGYDWHPTTGALWGMDHGTDWRGDELPAEELNVLVEGKHYGWPHCYMDRRPDDNFIGDPEGETKKAFCAKTEAPPVTLPAHSAPIGFTFYAGTQFPETYKNGAFVALHGSWNRKTPIGYDVQFIPFDANGMPGKPEKFLSGFLAKNKKGTFGRPAGLLVLADGSLLISDDLNGVIYRVAYAKK